MYNSINRHKGQTQLSFLVESTTLSKELNTTQFRYTKIKSKDSKNTEKYPNNLDNN